MIEKTHGKKDSYRFACDVIAGKTTNPSNWPYFRLGLFCASTRCNHWYEHCFGHVQFRCHWVAQLPRPWFTLRNCVIIAYVITRGAGSARQMRIKTTSRGGFTDANWNVHRHQCTSECERLNPHRMRITGTVWTGLKSLQLFLKYLKIYTWTSWLCAAAASVVRSWAGRPRHYKPPCCAINFCKTQCHAINTQIIHRESQLYDSAKYGWVSSKTRIIKWTPCTMTTKSIAWTALLCSRNTFYMGSFG